MNKLTLLLLALAACNGGAPAPAAAPAAPASASASATAIGSGPLSAEFVDLTKAPLHVEHVACEQHVVAIVTGNASTPAGQLHAGDLLLSQGKGSYDVTGSALVVSARVAKDHACAPDEPGKLEAKIVRASAAPDLAFAGGKMHAHLDADDRALAPFAYVGRLEGTAPVAEHAHEGSWELLCAFEAAGTFTLAGQSQRLSPRTCVTVPPNTKHSWAPDANSTLRAVQLYAPPGPEQRFKALAAKERDGGR